MDADDFRRQIPEYLTDSKKDKLTQELLAFNSSSSPLYTTHFEHDLLQGDVWSGFEILDFESGARRWIRGIVLSNSCDVSDDNLRHLPASLIIAPILKMSRLADRLKAAGISSDRIESKLRAIENQQVTNMFYLPSSSCLSEAHVALLDQTFSVPYPAFKQRKEKNKEFSLNLLGFYLLVFKLSVHFCRLQENVDRPI
jgi:hypothetical protein